MKQTQPFDVVVVGSIGVDTNVYLPGDEVNFDVEANFTENVDYVGQAGGYASRGYRSLGKRTAFIGRVGDDYHGEAIQRTLVHDGVDTSALFVDPSGTARSVNFMYRDGRRKNFYDGKGHMTFQPELSVCRRVLEGASLVHINLANWSRMLLPIARETGVTIACDLQDMIRLEDPYRQDFIDAADILFFSAVNQPSPEIWMEELLLRRPELIILSGMGENGCALGTKHGLTRFPAPPLEFPVIDTNGAGDMLSVGFLTSYVLDGFALEAAILRGQIAARHVCAQKGSTDSLITRDELEYLYTKLL